jgi:hypothetical protein
MIYIIVIINSSQIIGSSGAGMIMNIPQRGICERSKDLEEVSPNHITHHGSVKPRSHQGENTDILLETVEHNHRLIT